MNKTLKESMKTILVCAVAFFLTFGIGRVFRPTVVEGKSMYPTYHTGSFVLVDTLFRPGNAEYGDVLVFHKQDHTLIKRVVGLPGDHIECVGGILFRNGKVIDEKYVKKTSKKEFSYDVPSGELFMCGDNRSNSYDSRYFGPVGYYRIVGRVI